MTREAALPEPALRASVRALDSHFTDVAVRDHVPGIVYGVMLGGRPAHAGGVGVLRGGSDEAPQAHTPSRICSMTKSFVAAAVLLLRDEGRLRLDDAVAEHVPELAALVLPTRDSVPITVRDLLSMSSGLPEDDAWGDRLLDLSRSAVSDIFRGGATFATPPRIAYEYSNLGWVMLGRVVTNIAEAPVQRVVTERILRPLGMHSTSWDMPAGARPMTGHRWGDGAWQEETAPLADGDFAPMAGLWSTAHDITRWMSYLSDAFPPRDGDEAAPLSRSSRREMQQVHRAAPSQLDESSGRLTAGGYGFGLLVNHDLRFGHIVGHPGGLPGFGSYMRWLPGRGVGVVALANSTYAPMGAATLEALEMLDELGVVPPRTAPPISTSLRAARDGMVALINRWDDARAAALFSANVFLDEERERRRAHLGGVRGACGTLTVRGEDIGSATRAVFLLKGEHTDARLSLMMSPEVPPRIEWYGIEVI